MDVLLVFEPRAARHDLAEEREGEVRVVPARTCRQYLFCVREPGDQPVAIGKLERLPDVARHFALKTRHVREQPAKCRAAVMRLLDVLLEPIVELELTRVAQLHDRGGRERLRDRADAILRVGRRLLLSVDVRETERLLPHELAVPDGGSADRRDPFACLGLTDKAGQLGDRRLRLRQASSTPRE